MNVKSVTLKNLSIIWIVFLFFLIFDSIFCSFRSDSAERANHRRTCWGSPPLQVLTPTPPLQVEKFSNSRLPPQDAGGHFLYIFQNSNIKNRPLCVLLTTTTITTITPTTTTASTPTTTFTTTYSPVMLMVPRNALSTV